MPKRLSREWFPTSQAAIKLGCTPKYLLSKKNDLFIRGKHYRVLDPRAWRPTYRWHVERIKAAMDGLDSLA